MSLYPQDIEGGGIKAKRPVTTISIYVDDMPAFHKVKADLLTLCKDANNADVTREILTAYHYHKHGEAS